MKRKWMTAGIAIALLPGARLAQSQTFEPSRRNVQPAYVTQGAEVQLVDAPPPSAYPGPAPIYRGPAVPRGAEQPQEIYPPAIVPGYAYRPIIPVVRMPQSYYVGRGIIGQPTVYVPGQPIRNFLRFLSP